MSLLKPTFFRPLGALRTAGVATPALNSTFRYLSTSHSVLDASPSPKPADVVARATPGPVTVHESPEAIAADVTSGAPCEWACAVIVTITSVVLVLGFGSRGLWCWTLVLAPLPCDLHTCIPFTLNVRPSPLSATCKHQTPFPKNAP